MDSLQTLNINNGLDNHAIVAHTDAQGIITRVNAKFCEISGFSEGELLGKTHAVVNSGIHPKEFFIDMWQTIAAGKVWHGDICNRKKDGSIYWVNSTITPERDAKGKISGFIAIRTDVTRVKLENILNQAQQKAIFAIMHGGGLAEAIDTTLKDLALLDPSLKFSVLQLKNGRYLHHLAASGLSVNYIDAIDGIEIGPSAGSCGTAAYRKSFVGVDDIQTHPYWADYKEVAAESGLASCWSLPILSGQGKVFGTIALYSDKPQSATGYVLELHEQAAKSLAMLFLFFEERTRYLNQNIKLNNIIQSSPFCIHEIDLEGRLLSMNESGLKMMSASSEDDIKGIYYPDLSCKAQQRQEAAQLFHEALQGKSGHFDYEMEVNGKTRYYSSSFTPMRNSDGDIYSILGITEDATTRQRNYLALMTAKNAAQQADEAKTAFLANMSHELRTPLNHIIGFSEILEMNAQGPNLLENVKYIKQAGHVLLDKINNVLELVGQSDRPSSFLERMDIVKLVNTEFVGYFQSLAQKSKRKFTTTIPDQEIYIVADWMSLLSAFRKIAENAVRFSSEGDIVGISILTDDDSVTLAIFDTGPGLPPNILLSRLDPFIIGEKVTTKTNSGMGLGLAIAKKLCTQNGGKFDFGTDEKVGTKIYFRFPMVPPKSDHHK